MSKDKKLPAKLRAKPRHARASLLLSTLETIACESFRPEFLPSGPMEAHWRCRWCGEITFKYPDPMPHRSVCLGETLRGALDRAREATP